jgi:hypothetical protein
MSCFVGSFLQLSFLFWLGGVVCLCGGITMECKWQLSPSCFQLPKKAYKTACCVKVSQQVKL